MIFGQKTLYFPIFSPWLHLGQIILRGSACKGAYKRPETLTVVNCVLYVSTITISIDLNGILLVPWSSCLGGYSSVPDDYPLVLGCEEHVSSLGVFVA